jgi:hypothetical protein
VKKLTTWFKKYWLAVLLGVNFTISGFIFANPTTLDSSPSAQIVDHLRTSFALLGILSFGAESYYRAFSLTPKEYIFGRFSAYLMNDPYSQLTMAVLLIISGSMVGCVIWLLLRTPKTRRITTLLLSINLGVMILQTVFLVLPYFNIGAKPRDESRYVLYYECVIPIKNETSIRISAFTHQQPPNVKWVGIPSEISYSILYDNGGTAREFMRILKPASKGQCDRAGVLNDNFVWIWELGTLITSQDSGRTWRVWDTRQLGGEYAGGNFGKANSNIMAVTFEDPMIGQMQLEYHTFYNPRSGEPALTDTPSPSILYTTDGGLTWFFDKPL